VNSSEDSAPFSFGPIVSIYSGPGLPCPRRLCSHNNSPGEEFLAPCLNMSLLYTLPLFLSLNSVRVSLDHCLPKWLFRPCSPDTRGSICGPQARTNLVTSTTGHRPTFFVVRGASVSCGRGPVTFRVMSPTHSNPAIGM